MILSVAHVKECKDENLCPVDYSIQNANVTDQGVSADDQTGQNVAPVGDQETGTDDKTGDQELGAEQTFDQEPYVDETLDEEPGADQTGDQEPNADQPGNVQDDKSGVMYSDSQSDVDDTGEQELVADDQPGDVPDKSGDDTGDQSDITVEYSQETMAELPVGQNEQTGETNFVLPLKKRKYEHVDKQHEILQKELFVKLECLDYQKWCQDTEPGHTEPCYKTKTQNCS